MKGIKPNNLDQYLVEERLENLDLENLDLENLDLENLDHDHMIPTLLKLKR